VSELVTYHRDGKIGHLVLNRPEKLNAISPELIADYETALKRFISDPEARVAVLRGEGRAFCVGMDLSPEANYVHPDAASDRTQIEEMARSWLRLWDCPKPVIAQVHGHCLAAGMQLAMCCDIVVIAEDATLGWPKLPVGAGWISPMWSFHVGIQRAKLMSYRVGSTISGREAYDAGFAALVFPSDSLQAESIGLAAEIAKLPSDILRIKKFANNRVLEAQGFRTAVLSGAEWDALAHTTAAVDTSREWIEAEGLKGAIERFQRTGM
jgi:enoyl-CoA hydratase